MQVTLGEAKSRLYVITHQLICHELPPPLMDMKKLHKE